MPKITKKMFVVAGKQYDCEVWYNASDKFFLKGFPADVMRAANIVPLGSKTEEELYTRFNAGVDRYEEIIASVKKVITFRMSAAKSHLDRFKRDYPTGISDNHGSEMGFVIDYEIKMLRVVGQEMYLHNIGDDGKPYGSGDQIRNREFNKIIDYTEAREAAFIELQKRFDVLFNHFVDGFFDAETFIDSIPTASLLKETNHG